MARDDYFVIVYQILSYLYKALKSGDSVKAEYLRHDSPLFKTPISESYWQYIIKNMYKDELITGLSVDEIDNGTLIYRLEETQITPKGIEYLEENSMLQKVRKLLKDTKEMIPFV